MCVVLYTFPAFTSSPELDMTSRREPWERGCLPGILFSEHTMKRGRGLGEEFHTNRSFCLFVIVKEKDRLFLNRVKALKSPQAEFLN